MCHTHSHINPPNPLPLRLLAAFKLRNIFNVETASSVVLKRKSFWNQASDEVIWQKEEVCSTGMKQGSLAKSKNFQK